MNAQERFLRRFDPDGQGFVYRATPHAPGVSVTAEERTRLIAADDDRRGIAVILYVATVPVLVIVTAIVAMTPAISSWYPATPWLVLLVFPAAVATWASMAPNRILRGRPNVDKGLPKAEAERRAYREKSWFSLAVGVAGSVAAGFNLAVSTEAYTVFRVLGALGALVAIVIFAHEVRIKLRVRAQDRRARAEGA